MLLNFCNKVYLYPHCCLLNILLFLNELVNKRSIKSKNIHVVMYLADFNMLMNKIKSVESIKHTQTNVILSKRNVAFSRCEYHTLSKVFRHVYVIPVSGRDEKNQNLMMLAADRPLALSKDTVLIHHLPEDVVFTDNYCPVERIASYAGLADVSLSGAEQLSKKR